MIEASLSAVPGLVVSVLVLAVLTAAPTALVAKATGRPWPLRTALAVYLAGILAVTLLPGHAGLQPWQCDTGAPTHLFTSASSLLNVALFAPGALLAVLLFPRPVTVAAAFGTLSAAVELAQSAGIPGRSCSVTDLAANGTGALLGSLLGALWLHLRRRPPGRPLRDLVGGTSLAVFAALLVGGVFASRIDRVDVVAMDEHRRDLAQSAVQADEWITTVAEGVFGSGTRVRETASATQGRRLRITATTNRGTVTGIWPAKTLESARFSTVRGDEGSLDTSDVAAAAARFAHRWFPQNVKGSRQRVRCTGDGPTRVCAVAYRRYVDEVMMPMRLDLAVSASGRVLGFTARTVDDPVLARVTVDVAEAEALAKAPAGSPGTSAVLLAARVRGAWRPVWLVGGGGRHVTIDAATGERVAGTA
ncbi:VanZ family protein [Streptomyces sp. NPDC021608]|uniref:VanZ family protein n=1 Tax=Streptomyces sp. NPDC021608 TaxID=3154903 RepID=UPI0033D033C1